MATLIKSKKFLLILLLLFFVSSSTALALEIDWPLSPGGTVLNDDSDVGDMIQYFYEWAIALGGLVTFVSLVSGGFKYLTSMGRPEAMKEAKDQITSAFTGLILLLSAWLILNVINPDLTTFKKTSYNLSYLIENPPGINLTELPGCDYVFLYPQENFGGIPLIIKPGSPPESNKLTGTDGYFVTGVDNIGSVKSFSKNSLEEFGCATPDCECEDHACGCTLELYAKGYDKETDAVLPCGDKLGNVPAWDKNLISHEGEGQRINCVRLSGIACKCRINNSEGECTTKVAPDTGWGENEYNCIGNNEKMNNTRCLDGECIACGGEILKDGCGGCSNIAIAPPDPNNPRDADTNPSEWACWYVGDSGHMNFAPSCTDVCKDKVGRDGKCVQAGWNEYHEAGKECVVGRTIWSCANCDGYAGSFAPIYGGQFDVCHIRVARSQECDWESPSWTRRFCVCDR